MSKDKDKAAAGKKPDDVKKADEAKKPDQAKKPEAATKAESHADDHGDAHAADVPHVPHVLPLKFYLGVWIALMVLTVVTVAAASFDLGEFNIYVAMLIATRWLSLLAPAERIDGAPCQEIGVLEQLFRARFVEVAANFWQF